MAFIVLLDISQILPERCPSKISWSIVNETSNKLYYYYYLNFKLFLNFAIRFTINTHNWIIPTPSQRPREPPRSEKNFVKDILGYRDSVIVTTWSKVMSKVESVESVLSLDTIDPLILKTKNLHRLICY